MREFLSLNSINFEERNIAKEPGWRKQLIELVGEVVVPVLVVDGQPLIGLDEGGMRKALGLEKIEVRRNRNGLVEPPALTELPRESDDATVAALIHLVRRLQRELEFNAKKGNSEYHDGQHDGMRFARDAILRILSGADEPGDLIVERLSKANAVSDGG